MRIRTRWQRRGARSLAETFDQLGHGKDRKCASKAKGGDYAVARLTPAIDQQKSFGTRLKAERSGSKNRFTLQTVACERAAKDEGSTDLSRTVKLGTDARRNRIQKSLIYIPKEQNEDHADYFGGGQRQFEQWSFELGPSQRADFSS